MDEYIEITPQDLGSVTSVLTFLNNWAKANNNTIMLDEIIKVQEQFDKVFVEVESDKIKLPYNRRDYYTILEYLKLQAEQLSKGAWNDFTDSDVGTVFLKLISYLADMNNYQIDKSIAELYLPTCIERSSALLLCRLIGYEPRHYMSAEVDITLGVTTNTKGEPNDIPNGTKVPKGSLFTTSDGTKNYTTLDEFEYVDNIAKVKVYEGVMKNLTFKLENVDKLGRIVLPDYTMAFNTAQLFIDSEEYLRVDNVAINTGDLAFSVHCSEDRIMYLQLPVFWPDVISPSSYINVIYCLSTGEEGRIGKDKITEISTLISNEKSKMKIITSSESIEGYNPETIEEIKVSAPIRARTMDTIVTIKDFEEVGSLISGIADIKALDYNDPSSGLIQPTAGPGGYVNDAYKVNIYVLPDTVPYDETNPENNRYRNTIVKFRDDWEWSDMGKVADRVESFSPVSILDNTIVLSGEDYSFDNIILGLNTGKEYSSYLPKYIEGVNPGETESFEYTLSKSGSDITITMSTNWRDFLVGDLDKVSIFFKSDQILTTAGQELRESIDSKRLASLWVTYYDMDIIEPEVYIEVYMDSRDTNYESVESTVESYILEKYSRNNLKAGDPIFASVIGADILNQFSYIRYVEVGLPNVCQDDKVEALPREFLDIIPPNVTVKSFDYQNKIK